MKSALLLPVTVVDRQRCRDATLAEGCSCNVGGFCRLFQLTLEDAASGGSTRCPKCTDAEEALEDRLDDLWPDSDVSWGDEEEE